MFKNILILLLGIGSMYSVAAKGVDTSSQSYSFGDMKVLGTDITNMKKKIDEVMKSVEKVGGYYKGKGVYRMPLAMFGFPLINIIFDSITVNTDLVALSGGIDAVNRGMKGVADVDEAINAISNMIHSLCRRKKYSL